MKITEVDNTKKTDVKETASGGATGAGAVATVSAPMGSPVKRTHENRRKNSRKGK